MRKTRFLAGATVVGLASGLIPIVNASNVHADDAQSTTLGNPAQLINGSIVQRWTVSGLQPSADAIPYPVAGTLWEATASDEAIQGGATPIVSNFNARTPDGHDYRVLFGVATSQGVNPATLAQGQTTKGKLYFDVTGAAPDSVVFTAAGHDFAVWRPAPPPATSPVTRAVPTAPRSQNLPTAAGGTPTPTVPAAAGETSQPAPAAGSVGTPLPANSADTPLATPSGASTGVPAPAAGSVGTPLPANSADTPLAVPSAAAPAPSQVPQTTAALPTPASAESAGAPVAPTGPTPTTTVTAAPLAP